MMQSVKFIQEAQYMAVNLRKGQKVDLTKGNPGLNRIMAGLFRSAK